MATLFVDKIDPQSGTSLEIGSSGDTLDLSNPSTVTLNSVMKNSPAFLVKLSSDYNIANSTSTKIQYTTEVFDTDSAYDNSTNYRFTVPSGQAGKYFFYFQVRANGWGANRFVSYIYVNGSLDTATAEMRTASASYPSIQSSVVLDLDVGDYIEHYVYHDQGGTQPIQGTSTEHQNLTFFGGYKLIGV